MIKDRIENAKMYYVLSEGIKTGFEWIKNNDLENMPDGRYDISDNIYANLQTYETKEKALFEAHRKFIDIQYMISGIENCGIENYKKTKTVKEYVEDKDIEFLESNSGGICTLSEGEFFIFYPQDAHKPSLSFGEKQKVKKVVVKIPVK